MPFVYFATACFVVWLVKTSGIYPSGSDTMYHVYRGDYVYNAIKSGNLYPLYDPAWYNGVEILRYWSPFPAYVMAFCQYLAGGSHVYGHLSEEALTDLIWEHLSDSSGSLCLIICVQYL